METETLFSACRQLRKRLGKTQNEMAPLVGQKTASSIQRYEGSLPGGVAGGEALARYVILAAENGHHDLAAVFRVALEEDIPDAVLDALAYKPQSDTKVRVIPAISIPATRRSAPLLMWFKNLIERPATPSDQKLVAYLEAEMQSAPAEESEQDTATNGM